MAVSPAKHLAAAAKKLRSGSSRSALAAAGYLSERLAELAPLLDVPAREVQGALGDADGLGADGDAAVVERAERQREALALVAEAVGGGDAHVLADDLGGGRAAHTQLVLVLADLEPGHGVLEHERGDAARARVRVGHGVVDVDLADT